MKEERDFYERLSEKGVSRRDFMKFCGALTATMGLSSSFIPKVAEVFAAPAQRPPVIWLHFAQCTGCSEAALRSMYPWIDQLVVNVLDVAYHETIMAAAGYQAEDALHAALKKYDGKFICVIEGAIGTKYNGGWGKIGGQSFMQVAKEVVPKAAAVICIGACASFGGPRRPHRIREATRASGMPWGSSRSTSLVALTTPSTSSVPSSTISSWANFPRWMTWEGPFSHTARRFMTSVRGEPTMKTMNL